MLSFKGKRQLLQLPCLGYFFSKPSFPSAKRATIMLHTLSSVVFNIVAGGSIIVLIAAIIGKRYAFLCQSTLAGSFYYNREVFSMLSHYTRSFVKRASRKIFLPACHTFETAYIDMKIQAYVIKAGCNGSACLIGIEGRCLFYIVEKGGRA